MAKKSGSKKPPEPAPDPNELVVLYLEVPAWVKDGIARLAKQHDRKMTGEAIVALKEYLARHSVNPPES